MTNHPVSSRRHFIKRSLAACAATTSLIGTQQSPTRAAVSPGEEIIIGFIGCGNGAKQLMEQVPSPGRIVAAADCFVPRAEEASRLRGDGKWAVYQDYRRMLDQERLDAVVVATPDHVRTLPCIHAVQAGLDVYAEKPLTAYVREGRRLVDEVRRNQRIFQVGSQQRTMEINRFCCEFVRQGRLGKITKVLGVNYPGPRPNVDLPEEAVPTGDDWDAWCGPTQLRPFNSQLQFGWMQWHDYSGGEMTNWGAHGVDQIQWALGKSLTGPVELWPESPGLNGKTAMRYADGTLVSFELESGPMGGAIFIGTEAKMEINRNRFAVNPDDFVTDAPPPEVQGKWEGDGWIARPHIQNWLDCIKSRETPNADVEIGHRSVTVCHLLNIVRELGRKLNWDPDAEQFVGDAEANALLERPRRAGYELPS
ncbi:MAG: Gfo/Idh/MocA family oxidoreductase [Planctomycetales bacterium]|nr:Gfo/Idh/MocA family oxidoreductase [Planctomycetales bacterium]